ncbi:hypothetical protein A4X03_0g2667 [Tilletia caries]|uniref:non-specific serine/threonine protein kinase n=1 Tax=Tilletia caries TaxID=13290 RepID=A0A8T8TM27_9BASI|nr:hypothetical protein A4X03_0g2667 [Tilletia caries]
MMRTSKEQYNSYEMGAVIGHGTYGQGVKVAIRVVSSSVDHFKVQVEREIELQRQAVNEHVVQLQESFVQYCHRYIVLELGELGNLDDFIDNGGRLTDRLTHSAASKNPLLAFVSNASRSEAAGHRPARTDGAHRQAGHRSDLPLLQMTNFGAPLEIESITPTPHFIATLQYMAPDFVFGSDTSKADLWSIGVILFKMAFGMVPFEKKDHTMFENVKNVGSACFFLDDEAVEGYRRLGEALRGNNGVRHRAADDIKDLIRCLLTAEADERIDSTTFNERAIIPREGLFERDTLTVPSRDAAAHDESATSE